MDWQNHTDTGWLVVGLGEALFDCFGERAVLGGAPVNLAVHAHQLISPSGGQGVVVSRVGCDPLGDRLLSELADRGLDTNHIQRDERLPTGTVDVRLSGDGQPTYEIAENVAWDELGYEQSLDELAARSAAVCFGTLAQRTPAARSTIQRFLSNADHAVRLLDVNFRQQFYTAEIVELSLRAASALKLSEEELRHVGEMLYPDTSFAALDDVAERLCDVFQLDLLALTRGARGTVIYANGARHEAVPPAFDPDPNADSVGAGDACSAGLVYGLLRKWPVDPTLELANRLGAFVASRRGATPLLPDEIVTGL